MTASTPPRRTGSVWSARWSRPTDCSIALEIAGRIATNGPLAVRSIKTLATRTEDLPLSRSIELEQLLWGVLRDTQDRVEGRTAFAERRQPNYQGR